MQLPFFYSNWHNLANRETFMSQKIICLMRKEPAIKRIPKVIAIKIHANLTA